MVPFNIKRYLGNKKRVPIKLWELTDDSLGLVVVAICGLIAAAVCISGRIAACSLVCCTVSAVLSIVLRVILGIVLIVVLSVILCLHDDSSISTISIHRSIPA